MGFARAVGSIASSLARRSRSTATTVNTAPSYIKRYPTSPSVCPLTASGYRRPEIEQGLYDDTRQGTAWGAFATMINPSGSASPSSTALARTGKTFTLHPSDRRLAGVDPALMSWTTGPGGARMVQVTCTPSRFPSMTADGLAKYNEFISRLNDPVETDLPKKSSIDRFTGLDTGANTRVDEYYKFCMGESTQDPYRAAPDALPPWNPYTRLTPARPSILDILSTRATAKEEAAQATAQAFTAEATAPGTEFTPLEGLNTEGMTIQTVRDDIISAITTLQKGGAGQAMLKELGDVYVSTAGVNPTRPSAREFESSKADVIGRLKTRWTSCVDETMNFYPDVTDEYRGAHQSAADKLRRAVTVLSGLTWQETANPTENDTLEPLTGLTSDTERETEFNTAGHRAGRVNTTLDENTWKNYQEALKKDEEGQEHVRKRLAQMKAEAAAAASAASGTGTGAASTTTTPSSNDTVLDSSTPLTSTPTPTATRTETSRPFSSAANTAGTASTLGSEAVVDGADSDSLNLNRWPDFDGDMYGSYSRFHATVEDCPDSSDDIGSSSVNQYELRTRESFGTSTSGTSCGFSQPAESTARTVGGERESSGGVQSTAPATTTIGTTETDSVPKKRRPGKSVGFALPGED